MSIRVGMGVGGFPFSTVGGFLEWIDLCEASRIDSIWVSERLVGTQPSVEPMVTMSLIAGRTKRLKFGMNAIVIPFRDPLVLAKECATLDYLSSGRLLPAFGVGSELAPEFRATGMNPAGRGSRSDETLTLLTRLWNEEHVTHSGKHFKYEDVTITPRPVQSPLPIWIGGSSDAAVRRTARLGTGWLGGTQSPREVAQVVPAIKAALNETGRTIDPDHYGVGFPFRFGSWDDPAVQRAAAGYSRMGSKTKPEEVLAVGGAAEIVAKAREYVEAGASKFVLRVIGSTDEDQLAQTRRLIEEVVPGIEGLS
jgi:probable F420-dependent oxidoreductase